MMGFVEFFPIYVQKFLIFSEYTTDEETYDKSLIGSYL